MATYNFERNAPRATTYSIDSLKELSRGKWHDILLAAGMPISALDGKRGRPCPKCGGDDRYSPAPNFSQDGKVYCRNCLNSTSDPFSSDGLATLTWWLDVSTRDAMGWLSSYHGVSDDGKSLMIVRPIERRLFITPNDSTPDQFDVMARGWQQKVSLVSLIYFANLLGLPHEALQRLDVGWSIEHRATTWPMLDADGKVIGVRLRCPLECKKWAVAGSKAGLFYPKDLLQKANRLDRLIVCEGPTDSAALLSIGLDAVGVPSAGSGIEHLLSLCKRLRPANITVIADSDIPGQQGAKRIADALVIVASVAIITPPNGIKDSRAWVTRGATKDAIFAACGAAPVERLTIQREVQI